MPTDHHAPDAQHQAGEPARPPAPVVPREVGTRGPVLFKRLTVLRLLPTPPARRRAAPGRSRRRAAVAVATGFFLFFAAQLGLGWAIDTERSPLRDPIYFDKLAILRTHPAFFPAAPSAPADKPTTVLFVGSSRTLNAVDAGAASRHLTTAVGRPVEAFNFGQAGAGPVTNAVYVRRLMAEGVKADFALIEIHPVFLAGQRPDPPETRWLLPSRLRPDELAVARATGLPAATPPVHGPRGWLAPWYEYRFLIIDRYAPFFLMHAIRLNGGHQSDQYGFTRLRTPDADERPILLELTRRQYADYFPGYRPDGPGTAAVRDTLDACRAAGWRAALLLTPESSGFRGWLPPEGLRALDGLLGDLSREFGVPVIDARGWLPDDLIGDGHHLTGPGADVLTEKLARDALAPWIARTRPTP